MKIHAFHLMPWPYLPEDFREKYRSVYIDIPPSLYDPVRGHQVYNDYLDELEYAAEMGFDGVCVNEHHENAYGLMPSPNIAAASLARRTKDCSIIILGDSIALYNPATRVAEEIAMLDCISGGRIVAGFPLGTSMDTNFAYGKVPATLREKYHEAHDLIIKAWTSEEPFAWNGKYDQLRYVNVWPRPIQKPHPPIWVPGGSSEETWEWVRDQDYLYAHLSLSGYVRAQKTLDQYWGLIKDVGKEENPYRVGMTQYVFVADNDAQAEEMYAKHVEYFFQKSLHIYRGFNDAPGYRSLRSIESGLAAGGFGMQSASAAALPGWKQYLESGSVIAGSPEKCIEQIREACTRLRVGHLMILVQAGSLGRDAVMYNVKRLATEVLPHIRDLHSDFEDHWSPKPLAKSKQAQPAGVK